MNTQLKTQLPLSTATLLFAEAQRRGLNPVWETDYGLFSFELNGQREYLFFSKLPFNNQLSAEYSRNKHITHIILDQAGFDTIPYCVPDGIDEAVEFLNGHPSIVVKPTIGERSRQVILVTKPSELLNVELDSMILEKFIQGSEIRYLILQDQLIAVLEKHPDPRPHQPWHKRNETVQSSQWNTKQVDLALHIAKTLKLHWCAVDFIVDIAQKPWILEVNSAPGIKLFHHPHQGETVDVARLIFDEMLKIA